MAYCVGLSRRRQVCVEQRLANHGVDCVRSSGPAKVGSEGAATSGPVSIGQFRPYVRRAGLTREVGISAQQGRVSSRDIITKSLRQIGRGFSEVRNYS